MIQHNSLDFIVIRVPSRCIAALSERIQDSRKVLPARIVIGNPLILSQDFPPPHTVRESFPSYGVPPSTVVKIIYTIFKSNQHLNIFQPDNFSQSIYLINLFLIEFQKFLVLINSFSFCGVYQNMNVHVHEN